MKRFDIYINNEKLISGNNSGRLDKKMFVDVECSTPDSLIKGKNQVRVTIQSVPGSSTSQIFYVRLVRKK